MGKKLNLISNQNIGILGGGSWGTALAILLSQRHNVMVWEYDKQVCETVNNIHINKKYLPEVKVPEKVIYSNNLEEVVKSGDIILIVIPSQYIRNIIRKIKQILGNKSIVICSKGLEQGSNKRLSEVVKEEVGSSHICVLSGPSHAEEVSKKIPTTVVIASEDIKLAEYMQGVFMTERFRVYTNTDLIGVELGGALKNIIAIASGISDGLGYGSNTKAAIMTRGLAEMQRLGMRLGALKETLYGLAGIGDLITTCISKYSRNRYVGEQLGKGKKLKEILESMVMIAEGIYTVTVASNLARKFGIDMPITFEVEKVLYEDKDPRKAVDDLMLRKPKHEMWGLK